MKTGSSDKTLRKKFVLSFFGLFTISLGISLISILFLLYANVVSMDQSQALSDLRLVRLYLDIKYPGEWAVKGDTVFKGDIQVSNNYQIVSELTRYLRPETWLSFHAGNIPEKINTLAIHRMGFVMRLVVFLKREDHRLVVRRLSSTKTIIPGTKMGLNAPPPPELPGLLSTPFDDTFVIPGGIIQILQTIDQMSLGWIQLQRQSLGQGSLEKLVFIIFLIANLLLATVILHVVYRIIYKLSEPVHRLVEKHAEITVKNELLDNMSRKDPLTGVLNRRGFYLVLDKFSFPVNGACSAVAIIDLDNFKKINDTYGHACGDYVLKEVARLITNRTRQGDIACRWGGEEFLVFYSSADEASLSEIANRIRQTIADHMYLFEDHYLTVTVTIGFSPCRDISDFATCLNRADGALYYGKKKGKNQVVQG